MDIETYSKLAIQTARKDSDMIENAVFGLVGECGELVDLIKKNRHHNQHLDLEKVKKEAGDILWYLNEFLIANNYGWAPVLGLQSELGRVYDRQSPMFTDKVKYHTLRMAKEVGSVVEAYYSRSFFGIEFSRYPVTKSCAQIFFCLKGLLSDHDITIASVMEINIAKLRARYPDGKFDSDRANNRDVAAEDAAVRRVAS